MIRIEIPSRDTPGFLRRAKKSIELMQKAADPQSNPNIIDDLIEFILGYVIEPADRDEAREQLLDASEAQLGEIIAQIGGLNQNPTSPSPSN